MPTSTFCSVLVFALIFTTIPIVGFAQRGPDLLQTLPDFKLDLVLKADKQKHGSWICLAKDAKVRLLLGGQRGQPVIWLTMGADGQSSRYEVLKLRVSETMGMVW